MQSDGRVLDHRRGHLRQVVASILQHEFLPFELKSALLCFLLLGLECYDRVGHQVIRELIFFLILKVWSVLVKVLISFLFLLHGRKNALNLWRAFVYVEVEFRKLYNRRLLSLAIRVIKTLDDVLQLDLIITVLVVGCLLRRRNWLLLLCPEVPFDLVGGL